MVNSVKISLIAHFSHTICAGASQIVLMVEKKPPLRISFRPVA